jgi:peptidoglycan-associated lipoprotein
LHSTLPRATLTQQASWIKQFPEIRFKVFGHTDLVGSSAYNRRLGLRRAQAVVSFLSSQGISRTRLEAVVSFGEEQPLVSTQAMERRNRRTLTEVSGFVDGDGSELNGRYAQVIFREYVASAAPTSTVTATTAPSASGGATAGGGGNNSGGNGG